MAVRPAGNSGAITRSFRSRVDLSINFAISAMIFGLKPPADEGSAGTVHDRRRIVSSTCGLPQSLGKRCFQTLRDVVIRRCPWVRRQPILPYPANPQTLRRNRQLCVMIIPPVPSGTWCIMPPTLQQWRDWDQAPQTRPGDGTARRGCYPLRAAPRASEDHGYPHVAQHNGAQQNGVALTG